MDTPCQICGLFQPTFLGPKTQLLVETYLVPQYPEQISEDREIQNRNTRDNNDLSLDRGVGHVNRFQGHLLPHTNSTPVQSYQFKSLPFGLPTVPMEAKAVN